jgi:hypothetical protein
MVAWIRITFTLDLCKYSLEGLGSRERADGDIIPIRIAK